MPTRRSAILLPDAPPGEPGRWEISIPDYIPPSLNALLRLHHMAYHRRKQEAAGLVGACCLLAGVPRATRKRRVTITLTLGPRNRIRDDDNCYKLILDALRDCGALVDDSPSWVESAPVAYRRGERKATEIRLEDVN